MGELPPPSEMDRRRAYEYPDDRGTTVERTTTVDRVIYTRYAEVDVPSEQWNDYVAPPINGAHTESESHTRSVTTYEPRCESFDSCEPRGACPICERTNRDGILWRTDGETVCDTCYTITTPQPRIDTARRSLVRLRDNYEQVPPKEYDNGRPQLTGGAWSRGEADERFA